MKLFYTPIHLFAHKVLITAHEVGVADQIEQVAVYPFREGYDITAINPLNKVPTLTLDDGPMKGKALFGSQCIVEYLDSLAPSGRALYPASGPARWNALRRLALADTLFEVTTLLTTDNDFSDDKQPRSKFIDWAFPKIGRCLAMMDTDAQSDHDFDIGDASAIHALTYLELCIPKYVPGPVPQDFDWRAGHDALATWFETAVQRPSVQSHFQKDFEGDDSAENCAAKVQEVLAARG